MRTAGTAIGSRRAAGLAAALVFAVLVAGCAGARVDSLAGPLTLPPAPPALTEFDPSAEGVEVVPPEGAAGPMAKLLARSVVEGLGRYNVPGTIQIAAPSANPDVRPDAKAGTRSSRFLLTGHAGPNRDPAINAVVAIEWRVIDRRENREVGRFVDGVAADRFAWDNGDPRVIHAVGENAAHGFSTLVMQTPPVAVSHGPTDSGAAKPASPRASTVAAAPRESTVAAAPRESTVAAAPRESTIVASLSSNPARVPILAAGAAGAAPPYAAAGEMALAPVPAASTAAPENPLFLVPVSGAPGDGNGALTRGIRAALATRGYALADTPRSARYLLAGSVALGKAEAGRQPVRIVWEVSDAHGRMLGRAVQENNVAAGSLDGNWGPVAAAVAGAAVPGIADVLRRSEADAGLRATAPAERRLKIPPTTALPPIPDHAMLPPG